ncbi:MAG: hypothetical protein K6A67_02620 [Bacteroidales bacterium]|nr:hypothetical protein [Bacteroidales bacterium]
MQKIKVFIDDVNIDTQTTYSENGKINIYRCPYEKNPHLVLNGNRVSQKGRMVTQDDGTSCFRPYAVDSGSRYNLLFETAHGTVKETLNNIIIQLRFPKRLDKALIEAMFKDETEEVAAFIKTRPSETNWTL